MNMVPFHWARSMGSMGVHGFHGKSMGPMGSHGSPYGSKLTFEKTDLDHFPARFFLHFQLLISFLKNMFETYVGEISRKINEGVLERPGTKWKVSRAISSTLKCQFIRKCRKVDFSMPCKTKSAENLHV